jgi:hypothetical protein
MIYQHAAEDRDGLIAEGLDATMAAEVGVAPVVSLEERSASR